MEYQLIRLSRPSVWGRGSHKSIHQYPWFLAAHLAFRIWINKSIHKYTSVQAHRQNEDM